LKSPYWTPLAHKSLHVKVSGISSSIKIDKIVSVRFWVLLAVVLVLSGCSEKPLPSKSVAGSAGDVPPPVVLKLLHPSGTPRGAKFNVQANGKSAIAVECENATRDTVILFDNNPLTTVFGTSSLLTAEVPLEYYAQPRVIAVSLKSSTGHSESLPFVVQ
jgi:hypothetical protein